MVDDVEMENGRTVICSEFHTLFLFPISRSLFSCFTMISMAHDMHSGIRQTHLVFHFNAVFSSK